MLRLSDLNPRWVAISPDRKGQGIEFDSPDLSGSRVLVAFTNPLDGGEPIKFLTCWSREGESLNDLAFTVAEDRFSCGPFTVNRGIVDRI